MDPSFKSVDAVENKIKNKLIKDDYNIRLKNPLIYIQILIECFDKFNEKLIKKGKDYVVDFDDDTYEFFYDRAKNYFINKECILGMGENFLTIDPYNFMAEEIELNNFIKKYTNYRLFKYLPWVKQYDNDEIKTYLISIRF